MNTDEFNDSVIEKVKIIKYLGVTIDKKLEFNEHTCKKIVKSPWSSM